MVGGQVNSIISVIIKNNNNNNDDDEDAKRLNKGEKKTKKDFIR